MLTYLIAALSLVVQAQASTPSFKTLHVNDLETMMKNQATFPILYDVNVESTRTHAGVIPSSKLLSSSSDFDPAKELPSDKKSRLVFYCANTLCTASHSAAERAMKFGYKDVSVMVDGIYGWKKAGKPTQSISSTASTIEPKLASSLAELNSAIIVDVREDEERHEIIPNAISMPLSKMKDAKAFSEFKEKLSKEKTIAFHCARGVRAKTAAEKLASDGYRTSYFNNTEQWAAAGLKVVKGPAE